MRVAEGRASVRVDECFFCWSVASGVYLVISGGMVCRFLLYSNSWVLKKVSDRTVYLHKKFGSNSSVDRFLPFKTVSSVQ